MLWLDGRGGGGVASTHKSKSSGIHDDMNNIFGHYGDTSRGGERLESIFKMKMFGKIKFPSESAPFISGGICWFLNRSHSSAHCLMRSGICWDINDNRQWHFRVIFRHRGGGFVRLSFSMLSRLAGWDDGELSWEFFVFFASLFDELLLKRIFHEMVWKAELVVDWNRETLCECEHC